MRVKTNSLYKYSPNLLDAFHPCSNNSLTDGQVVRVVNLPSAPKANTMGQCYVAEPVTRKFICMVSTSSLSPMTPEERGCYERLAKRRIKQHAPVVAIVVETPRPNEAYASAVRQ